MITSPGGELTKAEAGASDLLVLEYSSGLCTTDKQGRANHAHLFTQRPINSVLSHIHDYSSCSGVTGSLHNPSSSFRGTSKTCSLGPSIFGILYFIGAMSLGLVALVDATEA